MRMKKKKEKGEGGERGELMGSQGFGGRRSAAGRRLVTGRRLGGSDRSPAIVVVFEQRQLVQGRFQVFLGGFQVDLSQVLVQIHSSLKLSQINFLFMVQYLCSSNLFKLSSMEFSEQVFKNLVVSLLFSFNFC